MELAAQIPDAITLGRGDPDLNTPKHVIAAARTAVLNGSADMPVPVAGLLPLREAVAANLRSQNNMPVQPRQYPDYRWRTGSTVSDHACAA